MNKQIIIPEQTLNLKFSLVMTTLGRDKDIINFLESLLKQSYTNYELIIVDQNDDDRVVKIFDQYKEKINIYYYHCVKKGISVGRNTGLKYVTGNIIGFPDDDCEYDYDTLMKIAYFFNSNSDYSFYSCNSKDKTNNNSIFRALKKDCNINLFNFLNTVISITIFYKKDKLANFTMDEKLGIGTNFGSGEESDLLLYLLKNKLKGRYFANNFIFHPARKEISPHLIFNFSLGHGAMFRKAISVYRLYILFFIFIYRLTPYMLKSIFMPDNKIARAVVKGRIKGFLEYK
jgi:glycosyltransferase involved in cell wall biosynthesis